MTVRLEGPIKRFIGSANDVKPIVGTYVDDVVLAAKDLPPGSTFLEEDAFLPDGSQRIARWNGERWTYPTPARGEDAAILQAVAALIKEINLLRLGMIEARTCKAM